MTGHEVQYPATCYWLVKLMTKNGAHTLIELLASIAAMPVGIVTRCTIAAVPWVLGQQVGHFAEGFVACQAQSVLRVHTTDPGDARSFNVQTAVSLLFALDTTAASNGICRDM
jgi:hypothetical protein